MPTQTAIPDKTRVNGVPNLRALDLETLIKLYPEKVDPMPIGADQVPHFIAILDILTRWFARIGRPAAVSLDTFIYYRGASGRIRWIAPDIYVAFDVDPSLLGKERSYYVERIGKPPEFVMEVASPSTANHDVERKPQIYADIEVGEYWMLDHTGGSNYDFALKGLRLVDGEYVPIEMTPHPDGSVSGYSEALGLTLLWDTERLQFIDPETGQPLRRSAEIEDDEAAAVRRASQAEARAERERVSRIQAETRAEREREMRLQLEADLEELRHRLEQRLGNNENDGNAK